MTFKEIKRKVEEIKTIQERLIKEGNTNLKVEQVSALNVEEAEFLIKLCEAWAELRS